MCSARVSLMRLMIAASVDDLPDPVGPVTRTMPFLSEAVSASAGGRPSSAIVGIFIAMTRMTIAKLPRCRKTFTRKRDRSGIEYERSQEPCDLRFCNACTFPRTRSAARRAVSSGRRTGSSGIATAVRSPCCSTCGGRPGENTRSLIPFPESSMAAISAGVGTELAALAFGPKRRISS